MLQRRVSGFIWDMAIHKGEIIISATLLLLLLVLFVLFSVRLIRHTLETTLLNTFLYFAVCGLYVNRLSGTKWRVLFVTLVLGVIAVIVSAHFYLRPRRWVFESRLIYCIDIDSLVTFLLINFAKNRRSAFLCTALVTEVSLVFINREEPEKNLRQMFTVVVAVIVYIVLTTYHVKYIWDKGWKIATIASLIVLTSILCIILPIYWYKKDFLFCIISSINTSLSLVPFLWLMCALKVKAWWKAYVHPDMFQGEKYNFLRMPGFPTRFTIKELEIATTNFQVPIGEGASGTVFKGTLADGSTVAVKQIKWQPSGEIEFKNEMTIIASRQHVSLVRLLGFCISPKGYRYLIYPFLENGSLDAWLFMDSTKRSNLKWVLRYRIAIDVAKVLAYLHHECHHQILHLDIKPANILLDGNFRALLSDFGISKLIGKDESSVITKARGTVGYLAPEMLVPDAISTKSDVYSYGMVLLELIGGRRNLTVVMDEESRQRRRSYFPLIVRERMTQGEIMQVVDESLVKDEICENEVTVLTRLALWCIQENPMSRPGMIEVVEMLEGRRTVHMPPESSMFVVNFLDAQLQCCTSCQAREEATTDQVSDNSFSISIQCGR